jgi:hypothetical protein
MTYLNIFEMANSGETASVPKGGDLKINNLILIRFLIFSSIRSKLAKQI